MTPGKPRTNIKDTDHMTDIRSTAARRDTESLKKAADAALAADSRARRALKLLDRLSAGQTMSLRQWEELFSLWAELREESGWGEEAFRTDGTHSAAPGTGGPVFDGLTAARELEKPAFDGPTAARELEKPALDGPTAARGLESPAFDGPTAAQALLCTVRRRADAVRQAVFGDRIFIRGLIEFTSFCRNDCLYCGLRKSNREAERYRLDADTILACCRLGYALGFRTFVLQGGEDMYFTRDRMTDIIRRIKSEFPDCALTLSVGERDEADYRAWFEAGADRYLLRHETADEAHYRRLHPENLSLARRKECLRALRRIGYQTGCGIMVGSPGQTPACLAEDMAFMEELRPHMIGIGPFIPQHATPLAEEKPGTLEDTLFLLSVLRLTFPKALLPATTALGTIHPRGRELGIQSGANVVMPNLSPSDVRKKYLLYDNKICTGDEAAECLNCLKLRMASIGCRLAVDRGDALL